MMKMPFVYATMETAAGKILKMYAWAVIKEIRDRRSLTGKFKSMSASKRNVICLILLLAIILDLCLVIRALRVLPVNILNRTA